MNKIQQQVLEFHEKFGVKISGRPTFPDEVTAQLRIDLIQEELDELAQAIKDKDMENVADAFGDILYVVFGGAISFGLDMEPICDEIHRSNLSKIFPDGTVHKRADGKILKPDTYSPVNLMPILISQLQTEEGI